MVMNSEREKVKKLLDIVIESKYPLPPTEAMTMVEKMTMERIIDNTPIGLNLDNPYRRNQTVGYLIERFSHTPKQKTDLPKFSGIEMPYPEERDKDRKEIETEEFCLKYGTTLAAVRAGVAKRLGELERVGEL
jgi:hypothetical protein